MEFQELRCKLTSPAQRLSDQPIHTLFDAVDFMASQIYDECVEKFYAILCAPDLKPVGFILLASGTESICCCSPSQLIRICALSAATSVCLIHNHPCTEFDSPSAFDDETAKKFKQILDLIDVQLVDFLIVNQMKTIYSYCCEQREPFHDKLSLEKIDYIEDLKKH